MEHLIQNLAATQALCETGTEWLYYVGFAAAVSSLILRRTHILGAISESGCYTALSLGGAKCYKVVSALKHPSTDSIRRHLSRSEYAVFHAHMAGYYAMLDLFVVGVWVALLIMVVLTFSMIMQSENFASILRENRAYVRPISKLVPLRGGKVMVRRQA